MAQVVQNVLVLLPSAVTGVLGGGGGGRELEDVRRGGRGRGLEGVRGVDGGRAADGHGRVQLVRGRGEDEAGVVEGGGVRAEVLVQAGLEAPVQMHLALCCLAGGGGVRLMATCVVQ